jgi:hypothetical protein
MTARRYNENSNWNDQAELKCLYIFKVLQEQGLPYGKQMKMCIDISEETGLSARSLSAKVSNFKSVAGVNNKSNASANTQSIYAEFGCLSSKEVMEVIERHTS